MRWLLVCALAVGALFLSGAQPPHADAVPITGMASYYDGQRVEWAVDVRRITCDTIMVKVFVVRTTPQKVLRFQRKFLVHPCSGQDSAEGRILVGVLPRGRYNVQAVAIQYFDDGTDSAHRRNQYFRVR